MLNLKNHKRSFISLVALFSATELLLGILVQLTSGTLNTVVSFLVVVFACVFAFVAFSRERDYLYTQIALFATVMADLFLVVITPTYRVAGMVFFSIAQIFYFLRIYNEEKSHTIRRVHLIVRGSVIAIALLATIIVLKEKNDFLSLISLFYYANLLTSLVFAFLEGKRMLVLAIGLACFAMCDAVIGLSTMAELYIAVEEGSLLYSIIHPGFNLAWIFYVPSQALISISTIKFKGKA